MDAKKDVKCPECNCPIDENSQLFLTAPTILGVTSSKLDNFEWSAKHRFEKAQNESRVAREEAVSKGMSPYRNMDDISSGENFDPSNW